MASKEQPAVEMVAYEFPMPEPPPPDNRWYVNTTRGKWGGAPPQVGEQRIAGLLCQVVDVVPLPDGQYSIGLVMLDKDQQEAWHAKHDN